MAGLATEGIGKYIVDQGKRLDQSNEALGQTKNALATSVAQNAALAEQNTRLSELTQGQHKLLTEMLEQKQALFVDLQSAQNQRLETSIQATQTAFEMRDYRVMATAEAFRDDPQLLEAEKAKIPFNLLYNSFQISLHYSHKYGLKIKGDSYTGGGTGAITHLETKHGKTALLTAGHVLWGTPGYSLDGIQLNQPQFSDSVPTYIQPGDYQTFFLQDQDSGLIILNTSKLQLPSHVVREIPIDKQWTPEIGQDLRSITFPVGARRGQGIGYSLSSFKIVDEAGTSRVIPETIGDTLISSGSSGGLVGEPDGTGVGIFVAISARGAYILPIGDSYSRLLKMANIG